MNYQRVAIGVMCIAGGIAQADIVRIGEFDSLQFESFDDKRWGFEREAQEVFGGLGEVFASRGGYIHTTNGWSLRSGDWRGSTRGYDGKMLGNSRGSIIYRFDKEQRSFGGFFATIADVADGSILFYNANNQLVGQGVVHASVGGDWGWNGWASEAAFTRVEVKGNYGGERGGFLMHDSIRISSAAVPAPGTIGVLLFGGSLATRRRRGTC